MMQTPALTRYGLPEPSDDERAGRALYGDDFTPEQIAIWFRNEEEGYFHLQNDFYEGHNETGFQYLATDTLHFYDHIAGRQFDVCLSIGCADGADVAVLAPRVNRFIAVEPARSWWRDEIGGKPATYMMPRADGIIDLPDASVDLITCYSVLHHVPNVSTVIRELGRVLRPGGIMLLREPVISLGDFTQPRPGLTAHERGIPSALLRRMFASAGLRTMRIAHARNQPFFRMLAKLGINGNTRIAVRIDDWLGRLLGFNMRYWRTRIWHKIGPSWVICVLEKP